MTEDKDSIAGPLDLSSTASLRPLYLDLMSTGTGRSVLSKMFAQTGN